MDTELVGLLAIVIGDSWFAIIVLTSFVEQLWMSSIIIICTLFVNCGRTYVVYQILY